MFRRVSSAGAVVLAFGLLAGPAAAADTGLVGKWSFDSATAGDSSGNWSAFQLHGTGQVSDGKLVVDGNDGDQNAASGWARAGNYSGPTITDKTMISWVSLDSTSIRRGSPISLWKPGGSGSFTDQFDAVVFAEQQEHRWMAGSDHFRRTQPFVPNVDDTNVGSLRQIAISYKANSDGSQTITGCLNGTPLGSYRTNPGTNIGFSQAETPAVLFGPRAISNGSPYGAIKAHIDESRLYSRAVSCADVADADFDFVLAEDDRFPNDPNEQRDSDNDGVGDNADEFPNDASESSDSDGDGIGDNSDNCRTVGNNSQQDTDRDGEGDACDSDIDGDGAPNDSDAFPEDSTESVDSDGDGIGDNTDKYPHVDARTDADDDGIGDGADNCANVSNNNQADMDGDGQGDACDSDRDGDGVPNSSDNAPDNPNANQNDLDRDGIADVIDTTVLPLSAEACKKNGWTNYYDGSRKFKNQGDCVSFVATGKRNLPAG